MNTLPAATTVPAARSTGSLQVSALSPARAAALPLIITVVLPCWMVALLAGGRWNAVPGAVGTCGGTLLAVLPVVAGRPEMLTFVLRPPLSTPEKGCGSAVGAGGVPGTMTMCVSTATTRSPCFAAGCPIGSSRPVLVDVHHAALDGQLSCRLDVHGLAGLDRHRGCGGDLHALPAQPQLPAARLDSDGAGGGDRDAVVLGADHHRVLA